MGNLIQKISFDHPREFLDNPLISNSYFLSRVTDTILPAKPSLCWISNNVDHTLDHRYFIVELAWNLNTDKNDWRADLQDSVTIRYSWVAIWVYWRETASPWNTTKSRFHASRGEFWWTAWRILDIRLREDPGTKSSIFPTWTHFQYRSV